jgi:hypothetical protein
MSEHKPDDDMELLELAIAAGDGSNAPAEVVVVQPTDAEKAKAKAIVAKRAATRKANQDAFSLLTPEQQLHIAQQKKQKAGGKVVRKEMIASLSPTALADFLKDEKQESLKRAAELRKATHAAKRLAAARLAHARAPLPPSDDEGDDGLHTGITESEKIVNARKAREAAANALLDSDIERAAFLAAEKRKAAKQKLRKDAKVKAATKAARSSTTAAAAAASSTSASVPAPTTSLRAALDEFDRGLSSSDDDDAPVHANVVAVPALLASAGGSAGGGGDAALHLAKMQCIETIHAARASLVKDQTSLDATLATKENNIASSAQVALVNARNQHQTRCAALLKVFEGSMDKAGPILDNSKRLLDETLATTEDGIANDMQVALENARKEHLTRYTALSEAFNVAESTAKELVVAVVMADLV